MRARLIGFATVAALAWTSPVPTGAQQTDSVQAVGDLVNQGFGVVAALRNDIYEAERRLSDLEDSIALSASSRASPLVAPPASNLATQIARHPMVLSSSALCRDAFQELVTQNAPARVDVIASCIEGIRPRARHMSGLECSSLHWVIAPNGQLRLEGHVQGADDFSRLSGKFGIETVATVVQRPFPACAALEALELPMTTNARPSVRLLSNQTRVAFNESLAFEVTTPDFFSYVYVVYLQADGSIVNLTPRTRLLREQHRPNSRIRFGDGVDGRQTYTAAAPPGSEVILAITARSPINSLETLEIGPSGQYALNANGAPLDQLGFLDLLRQGIEEEHSGQGTREISAEVLHITVVP